MNNPGMTEQQALDGGHPKAFVLAVLRREAGRDCEAIVSEMETAALWSSTEPTLCVRNQAIVARYLKGKTFEQVGAMHGGLSRERVQRIVGKVAARWLQLQSYRLGREVREYERLLKMVARRSGQT